jgi:MoCo/4Fe-4S cofactor protein with predicted Tat translocation signal
MGTAQDNAPLVDSPQPIPSDSHSLRDKLLYHHQNRLWRSMDEFAGSEEFQNWLKREFPAAAAQWENVLDRRHFLKLMSAAFAFAGLGACSRPPQQKIVPYLDDPENKVPGQPLFFATAMSLRGFGTGLLIRSDEGRPTKVEGNPSHSASLGSTSVFEQAAILQTIRWKVGIFFAYFPGRISTRSAFQKKRSKFRRRTRLSTTQASWKRQRINGEWWST